MGVGRCSEVLHVAGVGREGAAEWDGGECGRVMARGRVLDEGNGKLVTEVESAVGNQVLDGAMSHPVP
jgi:hypothetical protein